MFGVRVGQPLGQLNISHQSQNLTSQVISIRYGTDLSAAGTEVVTSGITVTNTTTGLSTTSFNNATVPANNYVWLTTSATSGTVTQLAVTLIF